MNTYNENLRSAIVGTLKTLDLEEKALKSKLNAATFTLYHAKGATITARQKLAEETEIYHDKAATQNQALKSNSEVINLVASAEQANQFVEQSITNAAVSASNVQVAANAIMRLASDMGSVYSILNAGDLASNIFVLGEEAYKLINETAQEAEVAAQLAMQVSALTAEVSASTVFDKAKATGELMNSVLETTTADFNVATQQMITDSNTIAAVQSAEKLNKGALEMISVSYNAAKAAYDLANKELNLNLHVTKGVEHPLSFTVNFDLIKTPFLTDKTAENPIYPVEKYYIIVVKDAKKHTFSISSAESILVLGNNSVITVAPATGSSVAHKVDVYHNFDGTNSPLTDSDNEPIVPGENYVVFVMAMFTKDYMRIINSYEGYLSAPSQVFTLNTQLKAGTNLKVVAHNDFSSIMTFETEENPKLEVEYRCMFLPFNTKKTDSMLHVATADLLAKTKPVKPYFLFNVSIAEQVTAGNYLVAVKQTGQTSAGKVHWHTLLGADVTDNFGNRLIKGNDYLPVVLSYSKANHTACFVNELSEMSSTAYFQY